eukprot:TRINITY_DN36510_c0_g1_i1.p1 TRINITY_DN36510_c0_g1~~TRINITY_DN36510_c0_g1_i1.p1  ORF type:complete len:566 (+),score=150.25 TRINITY_DN36510_c0_g1_i1:80-1777(+)
MAGPGVTGAPRGQQPRGFGDRGRGGGCLGKGYSATGHARYRKDGGEFVELDALGPGAEMSASLLDMLDPAGYAPHPDEVSLVAKRMALGGPATAAGAAGLGKKASGHPFLPPGRQVGGGWTVSALHDDELGLPAHGRDSRSAGAGDATLKDLLAKVAPQARIVESQTDKPPAKQPGRGITTVEEAFREHMQQQQLQARSHHQLQQLEKQRHQQVLRQQQEWQHQQMLERHQYAKQQSEWQQDRLQRHEQRHHWEEQFPHQQYGGATASNVPPTSLYVGSSGGAGDQRWQRALNVPSPVGLVSSQPRTGAEKKGRNKIVQNHQGSAGAQASSQRAYDAAFGAAETNGRTGSSGAQIGGHHNPAPKRGELASFFTSGPQLGNCALEDTMQLENQFATMEAELQPRAQASRSSEPLVQLQEPQEPDDLRRLAAAELQALREAGEARQDTPATEEKSAATGPFAASTPQRSSGKMAEDDEDDAAFMSKWTTLFAEGSPLMEGTADDPFKEDLRRRAKVVWKNRQGHRERYQRRRKERERGGPDDGTAFTEAHGGAVDVPRPDSASMMWQ